MWDSQEAAGVTAAGNGTSRGSWSPTNNVDSSLFFLAAVAPHVFLAAVALLAYLTVRVILMPQPGQLLTLKGVFRQPLARLSRRVTDRVSATKTRASQPRTFAQVWDWVTFCSDAIDRLEALDDQNKKLARRCTIKMPQIHRHWFLQLMRQRCGATCLGFCSCLASGLQAADSGLST
ncbi:TPA: hypothetical protein ACH3X2_002400 [Trebouxia sp. C0005]